MATRASRVNDRPRVRPARRDTHPTNRKRAGRAGGAEITESEVVGFLGRKIAQAMNDEDGDISDIRKENFNYYIGKEYGDEREGYSKYISRETLEAIEWVLPLVLRVFLSGDQIVTFDPVNPEDEKAAKQETDITNHYIMKANRPQGFLALHHWMKDALMNPNGYLKVYMENCRKVDVGVVTGVNDFGLQMLEEDPEVEIIEQRSRVIHIPQEMAAEPGGVPEGSPNQQPQPVTSMPGMSSPMEVFDLKIRTTRKVMELRIMPVPGEEVLVDNDCTSQDMDEADFLCHRVRKTFTQLVNEGIDPDELDKASNGDNYKWNDERVNRLFYEDENPDAQDEDDPSMREFWVHECYAWFDYNGDGIGEQRRVLLIGDSVFENEETNYQPLISLSSILMPHKHTGLSYLELVKDLQLLGSVLTRQLLDNVYKINVRRKVFSEDALTEDGSTMEALLNTQAEFIPVRGLATNAFMPEPTQSIIGELLPVIQHFKTQGTSRTGVSPEAQVDPNALQEIRQDVMANAMDRASQRVEMLVRIFAETGYRQLMQKTHQLLRSHWDIEKTIKLRGEWVNVDPQGWRDRTDMTVNVGLGFNTKQLQIGLLTQLLSIQKEALSQGLTDAPKLYNTLERLTSAAGLGDARQAFVDPESAEYKEPQPQPDPNMILAQAQAKALEVDAQTKGAKVQLDGQKTQQELQLKQLELQGKQLDRELKMRELAIREKEMEREGALKAGELDATIENIRADSQLKRSQADKAMADGAKSAMEVSDTFRDLQHQVAKGGEMNDSESQSDDTDSEPDAMDSGEMSEQEGSDDTE